MAMARDGKIHRQDGGGIGSMMLLPYKITFPLKPLHEGETSKDVSPLSSFLVVQNPTLLHEHPMAG